MELCAFTFSLDFQFQFLISCPNILPAPDLAKSVFSIIMEPKQASCARRKCNEGLQMLLFSQSTATRETSFVHAISSAGVMYTLTRNCSMGDFENCGCDDSRNGHTGKFGTSWDSTLLEEGHQCHLNSFSA